MLCKKMHHVAYRCKDARETVDFYTRMLGLKFAHVMGDDQVPSTGEYSPHIHIFFELGDGSHIAFFEAPKDKGNMKDTEMPEWIQHFAFEVDTVETLMHAKHDLEAKGLKILGPINHDDFILSIYFFDPSGHRLELTVRTCGPERLTQFELDAPVALDVWDKTHDWSRREIAFGAAHGYRR